MAVNRSRMVPILLFAVTAYATGLFHYVHNRQAHGRTPVPNTCLAACRVVAPAAAETSPCDPNRNSERSDKSCPLCQAMAATKVLPTVAPLIACFDTILVDRATPTQYHVPAVPVPDDLSARAPPSGSLL